MSRVFADTFYFLALLSPRDEGHVRAVEASERIEQLVTTEWVLTELADALSPSRRRGMFLQTRHDLLEDPDALVVQLTMDLYEEGIRLYPRRPDKDWSLTDCISFQVMRDEDITEALTGDHHFEQAGFFALLK